MINKKKFLNKLDQLYKIDIFIFQILINNIYHLNSMRINLFLSFENIVKNNFSKKLIIELNLKLMKLII